MNTHMYQAACDVNAWVGQYPFRGIVRSTLTDLLAQMAALDVRHVVASAYESIFWENNLDAYAQWHDRLHDTPAIELWPVVNPRQPGQLDALARLLDDKPARGLRLTPGYHSWDPGDLSPQGQVRQWVDPFMQLARERDMVVQVVQRIADERWHHLLHVPAPSDEAMQAFARRYTGQKLLVSATNQIGAWDALLRGQVDLYVDLSRMRGPQLALEKHVQALPVDRLVLGTLWPQQIAQATLWQVYDARLTDAQRAAILWDNASRLLSGLPGDASPQQAQASTSTETGAAVPASAARSH